MSDVSSLQVSDDSERSLSLRSFLKQMKFEGYTDAQMWQQAKQQYPKWRDQNAYVPVARLVREDATPSEMFIELEYVPQKRRGSDIYRFSIRERFKAVKVAVREDARPFLPASFLTLTSNAKMGMEWNLRNCEKAWNKFMTLLRKRVGHQVHFIKSVELTKKGHAHIHALLFKVPFIEKSWISKTWSRLHNAPIVDIEAVRDIVQKIDYLLKHQQKILRDTSAQAYFWYHRKRSWTVSKDFWEWINSLVDLIPQLSNSNQFWVICSIRMRAVVIDQEKDPPPCETFYLKPEQAAEVLKWTEPEILKSLLVRFVAEALCCDPKEIVGDYGF